MSSASPKPHDPTMDDILASIRRIIADDHQLGSHAPETGLPIEENSPSVEDAADEFSEERLEAEAEDAPAAPTWSDAHVEIEAAMKEERQALGLSPEDTLLSTRPGVRPLLRSAPAPVPEDAPLVSAIGAGEEPPASPKVDPAPAAAPESLISSATTASVGDSFHSLSNAILTSNNARTLEDIVKDMLRPMLQVWLDDNLPPLVERLVRAEIERVARGRS